MSGENNLNILLKSMHPELESEAFVFLTSLEGFALQDMENALMIFKETEGVTLLVKEEVAQQMQKGYEQKWAKITLTIHSDLNAVGFLAAILPKLAEADISVNLVSAFFHDHLFIPWEKREVAMVILASFAIKI
jgi:hypothetical protein